jgi:hypothetical protein
MINNSLFTKFLIFFATVLFIASSAYIISGSRLFDISRVISSQKRVTKTVSFENQTFSTVNLSSSIDLTLEKSDKNELVITAGEEDSKNVETQIKDDVLSVYNTKNTFFGFNNSISGVLKYKNLNKIIKEGSGNLDSKTISTESLEMIMTGSGNITLENLALIGLKVVQSGSGNITLSGNSTTLVAEKSGSGEFNSKNLQLDQLTFTQSGSGNSYVATRSKLNVNLTGSGDFEYSGNPIVSQSVSGSATVRKK